MMNNTMGAMPMDDTMMMDMMKKSGMPMDDKMMMGMMKDTMMAMNKMAMHMKKSCGMSDEACMKCMNACMSMMMGPTMMGMMMDKAM